MNEEVNDFDPSAIPPNEGFKMALFKGDFITGLRTLQAIDAETLIEYLASEMGENETGALLRDLTIFEAKTDKSFVRGLCVGIAASVVDYDKHHAKGYGVIPTLRAGLSLLRNTNTDVVTGRETEWNSTEK